MIEILEITPAIIEEILQNTQRESLPYFEYGFITESVLKSSFRLSLQHSVIKESTISKAIYKEGKLAGYIILERADFDSEIFGYNVHRIAFLDIFKTGQNESSGIIQALLSVINQSESDAKIKYLTFTINSNNTNLLYLFTILLHNRFYFINTLLTFSHRKEENFNSHFQVKESRKDFLIRESHAGDASAIITIASNSHKINRFHLDPNLDKAKCDLLHATSARNSVLNGFVDIIYVAENNGNVIGYYSGKKKNLQGSGLIIGEAAISAVSEKFRGCGVFNMLDNALLGWFNSNTDFAEMGTYINNLPVHRTWIKKNKTMVRGTYQLARFNHDLKIPQVY